MAEATLSGRRRLAYQVNMEAHMEAHMEAM
jgi:hypothetical protein